MQAAAEVIDDVIVELLAAVAPALRASELFYATAQAFEADNVR